MIRPNHIIPVRNISPRPQKQRAVILHVGQKIIVVAGHHLHVFTGNPVRFREHFGFGIANNDLSVVSPGSAGDGRGGEDGEETVDFCHCRAGERVRRRRANSQAKLARVPPGPADP